MFLEGNSFCMSYSCGKDSALALYKLIKQGLKPVSILVTIDGTLKRSWFHGVGEEILAEVSKSLGIELIKCRTNGQNYEENFRTALFSAKEKGAKYCGFGDIDIEEHRNWNINQCSSAGLEALLPLWQEERLKVVEDFINLGFKSTIKTISKKHGLPLSLLGKNLDKEVLREISEYGCDPCGENGEYHTFCYDGPIFLNKVKFELGSIHESEYSYSIDLI